MGSQSIYSEPVKETTINKEENNTVKVAEVTLTNEAEKTAEIEVDSITPKL